MKGNKETIRFYFKVNNSKFNTPDILERQIKNITKRLIKNYNIESLLVDYKFGTIDDDSVYDRCRLRIQFS